MPETDAQPSLYGRLGGKDAINAAVDIFYEKVLADERLRQFFDGVDMAEQRGKQKKFLAYAFGGPVNYTGKDMREAHKHLNLRDEHFGAVAENLQATLVQLGVPEGEIGEVMAIAGSTREDVLNR
ncbi:MAG: group 1 truncated hemoglobin [Vicinamibacterales bacterium]|nr:group 1 truncated hemoglobin [Vicinamibacterales bacterium]